ncbi:Ig-like domain-containing protein [Ruminococcaceae bacterium OttesenSCG-928-D13]|nr:Ig-like domain-containing protein [Ruminococcaceae bacterium OttesenSCG-928-D13]
MKKTTALFITLLLAIGMLTACSPSVTVTGIEADEQNITLAPGESAQLGYIISANVGDTPITVAYGPGGIDPVPSEEADEKAVEKLPAVVWSSDNTGIATVDAGTGLITAVAPGECVITLTIGEDENPLTATLALTVAQLVESITTENEITLAVGESQILAASLAPAGATDPSLTYASSNPDIVTVSATGEITGLADGETSITITAEDKYNGGEKITATVRIVVQTPPESIMLTQAEAWLTTGGTFQLVAEVGPENITAPYEIVWTVSDEAVCTITPSEDAHSVTVKAVAPGNCTVTVAVNGTEITAVCTVGVSAPRPASGTGNGGTAPAPAGGGDPSPSADPAPSGGGGESGEPIHGQGDKGAVEDDGSVTDGLEGLM